MVVEGGIKKSLTIGGCEVWKRVVALLLIHEVLEHADVVLEGRHVQDPDDDVGQVVGKQHQALPAVLDQLLVVLPLIFSDQSDYM